MWFILACASPEDSPPIPTPDSASDTGTPVYACGETAGAPRWCVSCAAIGRMWPDALSGPYTIQPTDTAFGVYCDFDRAGGGWTLLATNTWGGAWTEERLLAADGFGDPSLTADHRSAAFAAMPFTDLLFETTAEYAAYVDVGDGDASYLAFQAAVPLHNCGVGTEWEWPMAEGTLSALNLCDTNLYIHPTDWEGGLLPCADAESASGPAWSTSNKELGCPLNDPEGSTFIADPWALNPWGSFDRFTPNAPLRMWAR